MMKKPITLLLSALMTVSACAGLAGCGGGGNERDENTILLWAGGQWVGSDATNLTAYIDWYNENNTLGVTIELEIQTDFEQTFTAAMATGDGPDLMIWDRFNTPSYAYDEVLEPMDAFIERDGIDASKFNATAYNEMNYEGVQYGLPLDLDMWGIYVNMDIVNAYNTANPNGKITCFWNEDGTERLDWTWDEMYEVATKLKGFQYDVSGSQVTVYSGYDGKNVNEFFYHNYVSTGQDFLDENGKADVNNEYGQALLSHLHRLYNDTYTEGYVDQRAFVQGQLAMYMRPTYFVSYVSKYASNINVRFMPQPKYPGEGGVNRGVLGGYGCAIPRPIDESDRTEAWETKKERCWDFMVDWVYNQTNMEKWAEIVQTVPALKSTHTSAVVTNNKVLKDAVPYADTYTIRPGIPGWKDVQVNVFNAYVPSFCKEENTEANRKNYLKTIEKDADDLIEQYAR